MALRTFGVTGTHLPYNFGRHFQIKGIASILEGLEHTFVPFVLHVHAVNALCGVWRKRAERRRWRKRSEGDI